MLPMKQVLSKVAKGPATRCTDRDAVIDACPQTRGGLVTDKNITAAIFNESSGIIADGCVASACRNVLEGEVAERIIFVAVIVDERISVMGIVEETIHIIKERT
jgi:hypothetical protein